MRRAACADGWAAFYNDNDSDGMVGGCGGDVQLRRRNGA